jgi:hypothetical protein
MDACLRLVRRVAHFAALLVLLPVGCNQRHSIANDPVTPSPPTTVMPAPVPVPTSTLSSLTLTPQGLIGGNAGRGTALLTLPAPAGGIVVNLSSSDPAVLLPASITVTAGRDSADFALSTQSVPADRQASIAGSVPERTVNAPLALWTLAPTFFSFASEPGDFIGAGGIRRLLPPSTTFSASCDRNTVRIRMDDPAGEFWSASFTGLPNKAVTTGTYDVDPSAVNSFFVPTGAQMSVSGASRGCSGETGQFVVREADYTADGDVRHFWATFEQHCDRTRPPLRGDVRVTGPTPRGPSILRCLVP